MPRSRIRASSGRRAGRCRRARPANAARPAGRPAAREQRAAKQGEQRAPQRGAGQHDPDLVRDRDSRVAEDLVDERRGLAHVTQRDGDVLRCRAAVDQPPHALGDQLELGARAAALEQLDRRAGVGAPRLRPRTGRARARAAPRGPVASSARRSAGARRAACPGSRTARARFAGGRRTRRAARMAARRRRARRRCRRASAPRRAGRRSGRRSRRGRPAWFPRPAV